ncbi:MAG: hypothetical protein LBQ15_02795 [Clostridium sp.]|jgi:hypothetical protein|nr:hypothetical protein [Clostridium sp.]
METTAYKGYHFEKGLMAQIRDFYDSGGGRHSTRYTEVFLDTGTREIWGLEKVSIGQNSWSYYQDPAILRIGNFAGPGATRDGIIAAAQRAQRERREGR